MNLQQRYLCNHQPHISHRAPPPRGLLCGSGSGRWQWQSEKREKGKKKGKNKREMASNSRHIGSIVISLPHLFHAPSEFSRLEPDRVRDGSTDDSRLSPQSAYLLQYLPPRYLLHTVYTVRVPFIGSDSAFLRHSAHTLCTHSSSHAKRPLAMLLYMFHQAPNWKIVSKIWICVAVARRCLVKRYFLYLGAFARQCLD